LTTDYQLVVNEFLKSKKYSKVSLDISDYPANNIPEFSLNLRHLYKTKIAEKPEDGVTLYLNEETRYSK